MKYKHVLITALFLPFAPHVSAQDGSSVSWELGVASEYLYRSVSQTDEKPTLQGSLTWTTPVGIYIGTWASGVDYGPGDPKAEVDFYAGYALDLGNAANLDVQLARYTYPGANELAFNELIATTTIHDSLKIGIQYSNDIFASNSDGWYFSVDKEWALPQALSLSAHAGRSVFDDHFAAGSRDYTDWNIGVSRQFGMANVTLAYYGTDRNGRRSYGDAANNRVFLYVSIGH